VLRPVGISRDNLPDRAVTIVMNSHAKRRSGICRLLRGNGSQSNGRHRGGVFIGLQGFASLPAILLRGDEQVQAAVPIPGHP